jgi:hypothetical protein
MISASCGNGSSERLCGRGSQKPIWSRQTHRTDISNQYLLDIDCPLLRSKGGAVIVQPRRKLCYSIARPRREVTRLAQHECRRILYRLLPIRPWTLSPPRTGRTARRLGSALKFLLSVRFFGQGAPTIPPEVARRGWRTAYRQVGCRSIIAASIPLEYTNLVLDSPTASKACTPRSRRSRAR